MEISCNGCGAPRKGKECEYCGRQGPIDAKQDKLLRARLEQRYENKSFEIRQGQQNAYDPRVMRYVTVQGK